MKNPLALIVVVMALGLLICGYTARPRYEATEHPKAVSTRNETRAFDRAQPGSKELTVEQWRPFDQVTDKAEARAVQLIGTAQYCTGWLLLGLAALMLQTSRK